MEGVKELKSKEEERKIQISSQRTYRFLLTVSTLSVSQAVRLTLSWIQWLRT